MKRLIATALLTTALCTAALPAIASDSSCIGESGSVGVTTAWGECMTPELYNERFSLENLSQIPSALDPSKSIAEEAGLTDDGPAAERVLGTGLVEEFTFTDFVVRLADNIAL